MTKEDVRYYLQSSGFSEEQINTIEQAFEQKEERMTEEEKVEIFTDEERARSIMQIKALIRRLEMALDGKLDHLQLTGYDLCFILHCINAHIAESLDGKEGSEDGTDCAGDAGEA